MFLTNMSKSFLSLLQQNDVSPNLKLHLVHLLQPECTELKDCIILGKSRCSHPVIPEQHPVLQLHMHCVVCTNESAAVLYCSHHGSLSLLLCVNIFSYTNPTVTTAYHIQHSNMLDSWTAHTQVVFHTASSITT